MEEEFTYEQLANKVSGASSSLYVLAGRLDKYCKKTSGEENALFTIRVAVEVLRNMSYTLDTIADTMLEEAPEE